MRQAALCVIRRGDSFLVSELVDAVTGAALHRPPGGGIEKGESPEMAVRRELMEELGMTLGEVRAIGSLEHTWRCDGKMTRERAWLFLADASIDTRLERGETVELVEADGSRVRTVWRGLVDEGAEVCPAGLVELLRGVFERGEEG